MNVLFITCGIKDPGTRFRAAQFFPHLEARGVRCVHRGAYGERYNDLFTVPLVGTAYKLGSRLKRAAVGLGTARYDAVVLQRTALDVTPLPERALSWVNPRMILDVDDAIYLHPVTGEEEPRRERTFQEVVRMSAHVIAGNRYLADHAGAPHKTTVVPTVIDTDVYRPLEDGRAAGGFVVGWMGTVGNFANFGRMVPGVRRFLDEHPDAVFRIVSNGRYEPLEGHPQVQQVRWDADTELRELRGFDVGLMPLEDSAWTRGKNGFKLIQYMAVGRPALASPVGVNPTILDHGRAGILADTPDEWYEGLRRLYLDEGARREMGRAAREWVVERYSIRSVLDTYLDIFKKVVANPR